MSASSGSSKTRGRNVVSVNLGKPEYLFILSWRGIVAKNNTPVAELREMVNPITTTEQAKLNEFLAEDRDFINDFSEKGWFRKTYNSVKYYVSSYLKENYIEHNYPQYNYPPAPTVADCGQMSVKASLIARLLKFYHMKNIHIPLNHLRFTDEQLSIINLCTRIPGEPGDNEVLPGISSSIVAQEQERRQLLIIYPSD